MRQSVQRRGTGTQALGSPCAPSQRDNSRSPRAASASRVDGRRDREKQGLEAAREADDRWVGGDPPPSPHLLVSLQMESRIPTRVGDRQQASLLSSPDAPASALLSRSLSLPLPLSHTLPYVHRTCRKDVKVRGSMCLTHSPCQRLKGLRQLASAFSSACLRFCIITRFGRLHLPASQQLPLLGF